MSRHNERVPSNEALNTVSFKIFRFSHSIPHIDNYEIVPSPPRFALVLFELMWFRAAPRGDGETIVDIIINMIANHFRSGSSYTFELEQGTHKVTMKIDTFYAKSYVDVRCSYDDQEAAERMVTIMKLAYS